MQFSCGYSFHTLIRRNYFSACSREFPNFLSLGTKLQYSFPSVLLKFKKCFKNPFRHFITFFSCFFRDASGAVGCEFIVKFTETGYSAVKPAVDDLLQRAYQINRLEANDSKIVFNLISYQMLVPLLQIPG